VAAVAAVHETAGSPRLNTTINTRGSGRFDPFFFLPGGDRSSRFLIYGSKYRLSEWQGAVLGVQLKRLEAQGTKRFAHARLLDQLLGEIEGITPQALDERCTHNGHYAYIFHYDRGAFGGLPRERFIEALKAEGIPEQASYPPLHSLDLYTSGAYQQRLLPEDRWGEERDIQEIAGAIGKIRRHASELWSS